MKKNIVGSMSEWSGMLKDLFRQIGDGSIRLAQVQAFLEHENPFGDEVLLSDWAKFYQEVFDLKVDLSFVQLPEKKKGFNRLIIVAPGMTPQKLYDKRKELFPCWKWTDRNLDEIVSSDRSAKDGAYAIWLRDRIEADEELKNLSANDLKRMNIPGVTLEERLLYELKFFKETGKHLDIQNITLGTGSRSDDGSVPRANWCVDRLEVLWFHSGDCDGHLRSRVAVS